MCNASSSGTNKRTFQLVYESPKGLIYIGVMSSVFCYNFLQFNLLLFVSQFLLFMKLSNVSHHWIIAGTVVTNYYFPG